MSTHNKLDHALRHIVHRLASVATPEKESKSRGAPDRSELVAEFFSTIELARHASRDGKLDVVIRTNDAVRAAKHIERLGGVVHAAAGARVITARIPFDQLFAAADDASIVRMQLCAELERHLNLANEASVLTNEGGERFFPALLGEGVLVGIVDTGIDVLHPAFCEVDKSTRIVAYWDQLTDEKYGEGFKPIADAARDAPDTNGHGTAVASAAAGNGRGSPDGAMVGVAPMAKIAMVKTSFTDADLIRAVDWLCERAEKLGLPVVINLSLGGHSDGHDGYDALSQHIDEISGKGRIVVVSAGNEGSDDIHAMHDFSDAAPVWAFEVQPVLQASAADPSVREGVLALSVWGKRHDHLQLVLEDPRGFAYAAPVNVAEQEDVTAPGYRGYWDKDREAVTGDLFYVLRVAISSDDALLRGPWTVHVKLRAGTSVPDPVRVHAWSFDAGRAYVSRGASPGYKVGSPGAARSAITVGSYATRNEWVTSTSRIYKAAAVELGQASTFSSQGPTRDQRLKPDLSAPGEYIGMAKSSRSGPRPLYQLGQSAYAVNRGTSFSAPYVAGAVAALLQLDPTMTPADAKLFLQGTVDPRAPFDQWGAGKLDCKRLLQEATRMLRPPRAQTGS
ncbi:MAG: S8 family serine peptidase [Nannocystaceae bacterium]|nr:S8 family serine peptidase [Nannocystaceae bacterium]